MIGPWTDFNANGAGVALVHVVLREPLPDLGRASSDDGVFIGVVIGGAAKYLRADDTFLQKLEVPRQGLVDDVLQ